jgi:cardiolipin synthase
MALIPVFAILLYYGESGWALLVFFIAGLSDAVDGFVARRFDQQSELGTILDPIADKLLITTSFIILTLPNSFTEVQYLPVPFWVTASVIGRDVLIVAVALGINIMTGFTGFKPSFWGKLSTVVQVNGVGLILIAIVTNYSFYVPVIYVVIVALTFISGIHYIFHVANLMNELEEKPSDQN